MDEYKETKDSYNKGADWHTQKSYGYNWQKQIDSFVSNLKGKHVLDVGCGAARDIQEFIKRDIDVEGLDYSQDVLRICKNTFSEIPFHEKDMRDTQQPELSFDGVWCCASLLNLKKKDVPDALSEFKRILKPEGILFISVKEGDKEGMVQDQEGNRYFSYYKEPEIKELLEKAGFSIISIDVVSDNSLTGENEGRPDWICVIASS